MYTVIFTLELPINGRFISFFSSVRWGSLGFLPNSCLPIQMRRQLDQPQQQQSVKSCSLYLLPFPNGLTVLKVTGLFRYFLLI